jgi:ribosomal protein S18 acetylase RimI-like enzyme
MAIALETGLLIEPLQPADALDLADFFRVLAADAETCRFLHPQPLTGEMAEDLSLGNRRDRFYLARYQGHVVGYSLLRGWDEGFDVPSFGGCTHPELRNAGVGHALLTHGIAAARAAGAARLRLTVHRDNWRAVHLYRKFGFAFQVKNARDWLGFLDLATALEPPARRLSLTVLESWARGRHLSGPAA